MIHQLLHQTQNRPAGLLLVTLSLMMLPTKHELAPETKADTVARMYK
jgi:hypothetical protein